MLRRFVLALIPALVLAVLLLGALAKAGPVQLSDFRALIRLGSPRFSPDGKKIAFITRRADYIHERRAVPHGLTDHLCGADHDTDADPVGHIGHHGADHRIVRAPPCAGQPARAGDVHRPAGWASFAP